MFPLWTGEMQSYFEEINLKNLIVNNKNIIRWIISSPVYSTLIIVTLIWRYSKVWDLIQERVLGFCEIFERLSIPVDSY